MALYIVGRYSRGATGHFEKEWHNGQCAPSGIRVEMVEEIQADCGELEAIKNMFGPTIPTPSGHRVVRWYGDFARNIIINLMEGWE